ncbi:hypothetical protein KBD59_01955 [Candidatus Gracilibacteria bacterium]|nr:hypothetical protein [Candidatus Gracilibacteria bacterium]
MPSVAETNEHKEVVVPPSHDIALLLNAERRAAGRDDLRIDTELSKKSGEEVLSDPQLSDHLYTVDGVDSIAVTRELLRNPRTREDMLDPSSDRIGLWIMNGENNTLVLTVAVEKSPPKEPTVAEKPKAPVKGSFALDTEEMNRLSHYKAYSISRHTDNQVARTYVHRLDDHIHFIEDVMRGESDALKALNSAIFEGRPDPVFIDIGPGLANTIAPAVTSAEVAEAFPNMKVVAFDLPEELGDYQKKVSPKLKGQLEAHENIVIVGGDGLKPMPGQLPKDLVSDKTPIMIRSANAIDIYCDWKDVEPALLKVAEDYAHQPVIYFFNKDIMYKPAGSGAWEIIGQLSERGFQHNATKYPATIPPYQLKNSRQFVANK